jgi:hypothetical protein
MIAITVTKQSVPLHSAIEHCRSMLCIYGREGTRLVLSYEIVGGIVDIYMTVNKSGVVEYQYEQGVNTHAIDYKQIPLDMRQAEV